MNFTGRGVLLDIEGTTSSVSFVFDVMFPYVRRELDAFLKSRWNEPTVQEAANLIARDAGFDSLDAWAGAGSDDKTKRELVQAEVTRQMDRDAKLTGLKQLQGIIWDVGFKNGEMKAHVYADVVPAIEAWKKAGLDVRIYSSGSVQAQKLFFGHSERGNLLSLFSGHYDTKVGGKREAGSYTAIAKDWGLEPREILFLSDVPAELVAARQAGVQVALVFRPGNATLPVDHGLPIITTFAEIEAAGSK